MSTLLTNITSHIHSSALFCLSSVAGGPCLGACAHFKKQKDVERALCLGDAWKIFE